MLASLVLCLVTAISSSQDIPEYFINLRQERTLFAQDEPVQLVIRLGNQTERVMRSRKFPNILRGLQVSQSGQMLKRDQSLTAKDLYRRAGSLEIAAHRDFRLDLRAYFPDIRKGGVFKINYGDDNYQIEGKSISVVNMPMPSLDMTYVLKTSMGDITIDLDEAQAPSHVRNFALLNAMQFYTDLVWHRVSRGWVIQVGDPLATGEGGSGFSLDLELSPFLHNQKYAVGMARGNDLDSATSQFYICLNELKELDNKYTVFGKVTAGFDTVDAIGAVQTTGPSGEPPDRPLVDVLLYKIEAVPRP